MAKLGEIARGTETVSRSLEGILRIRRLWWSLLISRGLWRPCTPSLVGGGGLQFLPLVFCELHKGKSTALSLSSEYKPQVDTQPGYLADFRVRLH